MNTIVGANGGFTIKTGSNNKRKILNVHGSPSHLKGAPTSQVRASGNSSSIRQSINHLQGFEERKANNEGNDIEMMSIGSNLRLEHLEEQPLRTKKTGSAAKPPKFSHKVIKQQANLSGTMGSTSSSGADDSTAGGHTDQSASESGQELNQSLSSSIGSNHNNGPLTRSPAKKKTLFTNSKLLVQLTKDGSPVKANVKESSLLNSHKKKLEEIRDFKRSLCYKALEQAVLMGEDLVEREDEI